MGAFQINARFESAHYSPVMRAVRRLTVITATVLTGVLIVPPIGWQALADVNPKRGGTLEFAVTVEPGNYDCHGNISFAFLHPIAPHYSTLLKFDAANYPQIIGDLAESWSVSADRLSFCSCPRTNPTSAIFSLVCRLTYR